MSLGVTLTAGSNHRTGTHHAGPCWRTACGTSRCRPLRSPAFRVSGPPHLTPLFWIHIRPLHSAANPSTRSSSSPTWSRKSARTPPSTEARGDTRCASSGRAWTSPWPTCRCSGKACSPPAADPAVARDGCAKRCSGPLTGHCFQPGTGTSTGGTAPQSAIRSFPQVSRNGQASAEFRGSAGRCGGLSEGGPSGHAAVDERRPPG